MVLSSQPARTGALTCLWMAMVSTECGQRRKHHVGRKPGTGSGHLPLLGPTLLVQLVIAQSELFLQQKRELCDFNNVSKIIFYSNILRVTFISLSSMKLQINGNQNCNNNNIIDYQLPQATFSLHSLFMVQIMYFQSNPHPNTLKLSYYL